jgi:hypothetical protein
MVDDGASQMQGGVILQFPDGVRIESKRGGDHHGYAKAQP